MPVSGDSFARPDRCRSGTMDHAFEARGRRVRDHLRRPLARRSKKLGQTAGNTVTEIVPRPRVILALTCQRVGFAGEMRNGSGNFGDGRGGVDAGDSPTGVAVTCGFPGNGSAVVAFYPSDGGVAQPVDRNAVSKNPGQVLAESFKRR